MDQVSVLAVDQIQELESLFGNDWLTANDKKYPIHKVQYDVLAASYALYRLYDHDPEANGSRGYKRWMELNDPQIPELITDQDRVMATTIRDYYSKQLVVSRLQSERDFSPYMKTLSKIVSENGSQYSKEDRGVYYRLPEYYQYDVTWDKMVEVNFASYSILDQTTRHISLQPVARMSRRNRGEKVTEFWFKDLTGGCPVRLSLPISNPLGYIVENLFDRGNPINIDTVKIANIARRGTTFITTDKWKITNLEAL